MNRGMRLVAESLMRHGPTSYAALEAGDGLDWLMMESAELAAMLPCTERDVLDKLADTGWWEPGHDLPDAALAVAREIGAIDG